MKTATQPTVNCAFVYPATGEQCDIPKATHERKVKNHEFVAPAPQETPAQHSPLPWRVYPDGDRGKGRYCIAEDHGQTMKYDSAITGWGAVTQTKANAELIVKCVNRSPAFQKLCDALANMCDKFYPHQCRFHGPAICDRCEALRQASEALRLAREGEE